jgi:hypothetical protein
VDITPGDLDWFEDFAAVTHNAHLASRVAPGPRQGRAPVEQHQGQVFDYRSQRDAATRSWIARAAQARRHGNELMDAFELGYSGLTLFFTFGHSLPCVQSEHGKIPLAQASYGLLAPFVLPIVGNRAAYEERVRLAFRLWVDYDWRRVGFDPHAREKNYFTPERWAASVARARVVTDEYVWIYGEQVRWWGPEAERRPVPEAYRAALIAARR